MGERILITVGGTREAIDPSDLSRIIRRARWDSRSLKQLVHAARKCEVAGITTAEPPTDIKLIRAISAEDMHAAVMKELSAATVL